MHYGSITGYQQPISPPLTPPLSPVGFGSKEFGFQPPTSPPAIAGVVPLAPEARLGRLLAQRLRFDSILGTGAYGVVYSAVDIYDNTRYAVKVLSGFNADGSYLDQRQTMFQAREIRLHHDVSAHPNVVSMYKIIQELDCTYVILEYCPEGDLFFNITECGQYVGNDALAKQVFLQLLDAVSYCHSRGIYHRDLKPENVLVTNQGTTVKLADFGLATSSETSEDYGCGSTFYMSPECLEHTSHRSSYQCAPNDVWSLGVILVNLTCGRNPWKQASFEDSTYRAFARNPEFLKEILPVSDELNDILGRIFTRDPAMRITMPELIDAIRTCPRFTAQACQGPPSPPSSPPSYITGPVSTPAAITAEETFPIPEQYSPPSPSGSSTSSASSSRSSSISDGFDSDSLSYPASRAPSPPYFDGLEASDRPDEHRHPTVQNLPQVPFQPQVEFRMDQNTVPRFQAPSQPHPIQINPQSTSTRTSTAGDGTFFGFPRLPQIVWSPFRSIHHCHPQMPMQYQVLPVTGY